MTIKINKFKPTVNNGQILNDADITSIDVINGNHYVWDQFTTVIIQNTDTVPLDVLISSSEDSYGKSKNIELNNIAQDSYAVVNLLDSDFVAGGQVKILFNQANGTSTQGKIIALSLTKP